MGIRKRYSGANVEQTSSKTIEKESKSFKVSKFDHSSSIEDNFGIF